MTHKHTGAGTYFIQTHNRRRNPRVLARLPSESVLGLACVTRTSGTAAVHTSTWNALGGPGFDSLVIPTARLDFDIDGILIV